MHLALLAAVLSGVNAPAESATGGYESLPAAAADIGPQLQTGTLIFSQGDCLAVRVYSASSYTHVAAVVVSVAKLEHTTDPLRIDGSSQIDERPAVFLCFSNSKYTGGSMRMAPLANVSDGALDVIRVGADLHDAANVEIDAADALRADGESFRRDVVPEGVAVPVHVALGDR